MYAKLENGNLEIAPFYYKGITGFNTNKQLMTNMGFYPLIDTNEPSEFIQPAPTYTQNENSITRTWIEKISLEELKELKKLEINEIRDNKEQGGFIYLNKIFDSDPISSQRLTIAGINSLLAIQMNLNFEKEWTVQDNTSINLNAEQLLGALIALVTHSNTLHEKAKELKQQILLAETIEEVKNIKWIY